MKTATPWTYENFDDGRSVSRYTLSDSDYNIYFLLEQHTRHSLDGRIAARVSTVIAREPGAVKVYKVSVYECVIEKFTRKQFGSLDEAKEYSDNILKVAGVKLLKEHMLVLK